MADFYVNFGSKGAKLIGSYKLGSVNLKLHRLDDHFFVISKNRKIQFKSMNFEKCIAYFRNSIFMETPDSLFNF